MGGVTDWDLKSSEDHQPRVMVRRGTDRAKQSAHASEQGTLRRFTRNSERLAIEKSKSRENDVRDPPWAESVVTLPGGRFPHDRSCSDALPAEKRD